MAGTRTGTLPAPRQFGAALASTRPRESGAGKESGSLGAQAAKTRECLRAKCIGAVLGQGLPRNPSLWVDKVDR